MALAELLASRIDGQREVYILGRGQVETRLQVDLAGRRAEQVLAAHHLVNPGVGVIDDHRQLVVGEQAVGAAHHEIPDRGLEVLVAAPEDPVAETDRLARHLHPQGARRPPLGQAVATAPHVDRPFLARVRGARQHLLARAAAVEHQSLCAQGDCGRLVGLGPPALPDDLAVPRETQLLEGPQNGVGRPRHHARRVEILHAQQPAAAGLPGQAETRQRRQQRTEMKRAGRAGGEAPDDGMV